jgi:hypothetical protein
MSEVANPYTEVPMALTGSFRETEYGDSSHFTSLIEVHKPFMKDFKHSESLVESSGSSNTKMLIKSTGSSQRQKYSGNYDYVYRNPAAR